jgi:hypothetical protein
MPKQKNIQPPEIEININPDTTPILYTEQIFISVTEDGVMLDICQKLGPSNKVKVVARIGMSKSHAEKFIRSLEDLVLPQLPPGRKIES